MRLLTTDFFSEPAARLAVALLDKVYGTEQRLTDCGQFVKTRNHI